VREVLLLRHAEAVPGGATPDFERTLTAEGRHDAERVGLRLVAEGLRPTRVVSSPAARALETARLAARAWHLPERDIHRDPRLYQADARAYAAVVLDHPGERILIAGHNPGIEERVLESADAPEEFAFPKGAVARMNVEGSAWRFVAMLHP
jgi:phosphohistidine phosphatase